MNTNKLLVLITFILGTIISLHGGHENDPSKSTPLEDIENISSEENGQPSTHETSDTSTDNDMIVEDETSESEYSDTSSYTESESEESETSSDISDISETASDGSQGEDHDDCSFPTTYTKFPIWGTGIITAKAVDQYHFRHAIIRILLNNIEYDTYVLNPTSQRPSEIAYNAYQNVLRELAELEEIRTLSANLKDNPISLQKWAENLFYSLQKRRLLWELQHPNTAAPNLSIIEFLRKLLAQNKKTLVSLAILEGTDDYDRVRLVFEGGQNDDVYIFCSSHLTDDEKICKAYDAWMRDQIEKNDLIEGLQEIDSAEQKRILGKKYLELQRRTLTVLMHNRQQAGTEFEMDPNPSLESFIRLRLRELNKENQKDSTTPPKIIENPRARLMPLAKPEEEIRLPIKPNAASTMLLRQKSREKKLTSPKWEIWEIGESRLRNAPKAMVEESSE